MNQFKIVCPSCHGRVVWAFFFPKTTADYCCCICGNTWKKTPEETQGQYGIYLGNWYGQEMTKLEEELSNHSSDFNWIFFKGDCIWTAWQENILERFIVSRKLDELIYWIIAATDDQTDKWHETYLKLRLT